MRKKVLGSLIMALLLSLASWAQGEAQSKPQPPPTVSTVLDRQLTNVERELVPLVEAMPADKFNFAPTQGEFKGVRNFSEQAKHVAAANYLIFAAVLGEKPPVDTGGENGPASITSKEDIVKFLKDSFAYAHKAVATVNEKNLVEQVKSPFGSGMATRLGLTTLTLGHCFDHYGQLVEYARMNGIIPPASRQ